MTDICGHLIKHDPTRPCVLQPGHQYSHKDQAWRNKQRERRRSLSKEKVKEKNKKDYTKHHEKRLEASRKYRAANREKVRAASRQWQRDNRELYRVPSFVYAIRTDCVLKIGVSTRSDQLRYTRRRAKVRGYGEDVEMLWSQEGDVALEAFLQACAALQGWQPVGDGRGRICEWFDVRTLDDKEIIVKLSEWSALAKSIKAANSAQI